MPPVIATGTRRTPYPRSDDLVESADTRTVTYHCPSGDTFVVRLFAEAEVVLRERRTIAELESLLDERLQLLRARGATAAA
jgi:hypothetical protein